MYKWSLARKLVVSVLERIMMDMELENIVANTVYIKAREGRRDLKCDQSRNYTFSN